jgi:hypothetical protein
MLAGMLLSYMRAHRNGCTVLGGGPLGSGLKFGYLTETDIMLCIDPICCTNTTNDTDLLLEAEVYCSECVNWHCRRLKGQGCEHWLAKVRKSMLVLHVRR